MTQEEKQLLLKDLSAREPYHPRINVFNNGYEGFQDGEFDTNLWIHHIDAFRFDRIEIMPYLRPIDSMTKEEKEELMKLADEYIEEWINAQAPTDKWKLDAKISYRKSVFYNSHHLDWNGLITIGLAIEAPEGMYDMIKEE